MHDNCDAREEVERAPSSRISFSKSRILLTPKMEPRDVIGGSGPGVLCGNISSVSSPEVLCGSSPAVSSPDILCNNLPTVSSSEIIRGNLSSVSSSAPLLTTVIKSEPCDPHCGISSSVSGPVSVNVDHPSQYLPPSKRLRSGGETEWLPSPGQMSGPSQDSTSPSPGPGNIGSQYSSISGSVLPMSNGFSPLSTGSYDPYSPGGRGRDDLSPSGLNGFSVDWGCDSKKKKGPTPRQQEELCLVCGDRASGYHYNALTCEGCKGFFRRSITKNAVYQCKYGNNCDIDMYMRRKCQECRLKKCLSVGMRPECVVPEYQCAVKREAKKAQKDKDRPNSTTNGNYEPKEQDKVIIISEKERGSKKLSPEQEELINRLVYFQEEFEQPSDDDVKKITSFSFESDDTDARFRHITEMTILTVQLIVEFSKRLPGFDTLQREDQITLLKACSSEVMTLRAARRYDINTDSIVFANNHPYTRDNYDSAGIGEAADSVFHFCRNMCLMKVDNAEYALLTAIVIFSERPNLLEPRKVEKIQEIYIDAIRAYVQNKRPKPGLMFAKLLSVLIELRTLGNLNSKICFSLKLKNKKLPPFLAEIWDIQN